MKIEDFEEPPCGCALCVQADVAHLPIRRDWSTGVWLHGYDLKRWYAARERFMTAARQAIGPKGRHASGLERLAVKKTREPGEEG